MVDKATRKRLTIQVFTGKECISYWGRLIGLVDEEEFKKIISSKELQAKLSTSETMPMSDIVSNYDDLENLRMLMNVQKIDSESVSKKLFISERLGFISAMNPKRDEISITGDNGSWMIVSEKEE